MYSFDTRVRYSETDAAGKLTLEAILDYFQDVSTFHSEDLGLGIEYLGEHHLAWVLSAWQIVVERYPLCCEQIKVATFPYDFKGFMGTRNFYMEDATGKKAAYANSIWTLMDIQQGRPARILPEMKEGYVLEPKLPMVYAPRKIELPDNLASQESIEIKPYHLDTNHHVNNGQYLRMALEYADTDVEIAQMRAEYKKSAVLGDVIIPRTLTEENRYTASLENETGDVYAVIQCTYR
ncbi:MAG: thioesterase [Lachnospiraceae bacterium]|nr:thioesterase [Lachnospiraceae bacterium]